MSLDLIIVIPARGGSQRVPRKNLALLGGRPLIDYTFDLLQKSNLTQRAWVSTEDEEIAAHTHAADLQVIDRPAELAGYDTPTEAVLLHALDTLEHQPDWIMTLQPTNPFRTQETLLKVIAAAESAPDTVDCIMTVTPTATGDKDFILGGHWRSVYPEESINRFAGRNTVKHALARCAFVPHRSAIRRGLFSKLSPASRLES